MNCIKPSRRTSNFRQKAKMSQRAFRISPSSQWTLSPSIAAQTGQIRDASGIRIVAPRVQSICQRNSADVRSELSPRLWAHSPAGALLIQCRIRKPERSGLSFVSGFRITPLCSAMKCIHGSGASTKIIAW